MKKTLLWISVLPAAIVGYLIATLLIDFSYSFYGNYDFGWNWLRLINKFFLVSAKSMGGALIFIYVGMKVAPVYKREVGIFLIAVAMMIPLCFIIIMLYVHYHYGANDYVTFIFHFLGCLMAFAYLPEKEKATDKDSKSNIDSSDLTPQQIATFRALYKAPEMPIRVIMAKLQAAKQYKESLEDDKEEQVI
ncbi:hypothetical protein EON73_04930 [bacterium]|nr:MAG: hypothetical protein EON73_04930 [bacterium]